MLATLTVLEDQHGHHPSHLQFRHGEQAQPRSQQPPNQLLHWKLMHLQSLALLHQYLAGKEASHRHLHPMLLHIEDQGRFPHQYRQPFRLDAVLQQPPAKLRSSYLNFQDHRFLQFDHGDNHLHQGPYQLLMNHLKL